MSHCNLMQLADYVLGRQDTIVETAQVASQPANHLSETNA